MRISQSTTEQPQMAARRNLDNKKNNISFKGAGMVAMMDAIDRGGLFASFTIQDMLGTNIPRPLMGLKRNQKENKGKKNTAFAIKETIREFTTGPSMFLIPGVMLYGAGKMFGKAVNVPAKFIKGLGDIFKDTLTDKTIKNHSDLKKEYYQTTLNKILSESTQRKDINFDKEAKEIAEQIISLEGKHHQNPIQKMIGKPVKKSYDDAFAQIENRFINIMKKYVSKTDADFTAAKLPGVGETSFDRIVKHMVNYGNDAIKNVQKQNTTATTAKKIIDNFNIKRINTRFGLNIAMATSVIAFLAFIPKLYNITKENPGVAGLEPEKNPTVDQTKKQEKA